MTELDDLDLDACSALASAGLGLLASFVLNELAAAQAAGTRPLVTAWVHRAIETGRDSELTVAVAQTAWLADYRDRVQQVLSDEASDATTKEAASLAVLGVQLIGANFDADEIRAGRLLEHSGMRVCEAAVRIVLDAIIRDLSDETGARTDKVLQVLMGQSR